MKSKLLFSVLLIGALLCSLTAFAQTNSDSATNAIAGAVTPPPAPPAIPPSSSLNPYVAFVAVLVPLVVAFIKKKIWADIPSWCLPIIAMGLGALGTWIMGEASLTTLNPAYGLILGAAGVGVREIKDQLIPAQPAPGAS